MSLLDKLFEDNATIEGSIQVLKTYLAKQVSLPDRSLLILTHDFQAFVAYKMNIDDDSELPDMKATLEQNIADFYGEQDDTFKNILELVNYLRLIKEYSGLMFQEGSYMSFYGVLDPEIFQRIYNLPKVELKEEDRNFLDHYTRGSRVLIIPLPKINSVINHYKLNEILDTVQNNFDVLKDDFGSAGSHKLRDSFVQSLNKMVREYAKIAVPYVQAKYATEKKNYLNNRYK